MTERRYYLRFTLAIFATMLAIIALVALLAPSKAHAHTRRRVKHHRVVRHRSRRVVKSAGQVRITRYGGAGEWQGTAGARRIGLPSNTRDLTNAGIMFFAHRSLPFGTRVMFTHDGYQAVGICVDRGPYTSAVYDLGPILGNELRCSGSDRVRAEVLR